MPPKLSFSAAPYPAMVGRMKLLIVEDDRVQALMVGGLIQTRADGPMELCWASTLAEAVERLTGEHHDAALLDLNLPDSRGLDSYRRLSRASPHTPVVVLTGEEDTALAMEAVREGAQDFLVKGSVDGRTIYRAALYAIERNGRERAERQLLCVQEQERKRVARELHDGVIQTLLSIRLRLQMLGDSRGADCPVAPELRRFADEACEAAEEVRRICRDLHPEVLECRRLHEAVRWYLSKQSSSAGIEWEVELEPLEELEPAIKQHLFRVFQEAVRNVLQHSCARRVRVALRVERDEVVLSVRDDGCGFDVPAAEVSRAGLGLVSLRERAKLLQGSLRLESRPGSGTLVEVRAPVQASVMAESL